MKAETYLEIAVEHGVVIETPETITFNGITYPNTPEGRKNCGVAIAMTDGEDAE